MSKNIKKIQDMLTGKYKDKVQVGYQAKTTHQRKEGEEWVDARGRRWKIQEGQRKQITKVPPRGFDNCNDCDKLILKTLDQQTYNRMGRCYHCQLFFETELKRQGKWKEWVVDQEKMRYEAVWNEIQDAMREVKESKALKLDKTVANAIGNHEQEIKSG